MRMTKKTQQLEKDVSIYMCCAQCVAMRVDEDDFDLEGAHLQVAPGQNSLRLTLSHMRRGCD